jgi:hypothetical protein
MNATAAPGPLTRRLQRRGLPSIAAGYERQADVSAELVALVAAHVAAARRVAA